MLVPALIAAMAVALAAWRWGVALSPVVQVLSVIVVGYVLGYEVWHADIGPLPLTLDRVLLLGFGGLAVWRVCRDGLPRVSLLPADWALLAVCSWLSVSCVLNAPGDGATLPDSPKFRLIVSFWVPLVLYLGLRHGKIGERSARVWLLGLASLGVYLGVTALLETAGVWSLVFPRHIADPELGLHFGRARGPALNSVSLGVYLGVGAVAACLLIPRASRAMQVFWFGATLLMCLGVLLTYTRSTWLGLAAAIVVVVAMQMPRRWRVPSILGAVVLGGALLLVAKDAIVGLEREDTGSVSAHSVQQRTAFAYVSWRMFADHPLTGVGFGRFYDKKLPYLTDRRQSFELESLRGLHHHNTFLSLLTETGLLGLGAYLATLAGLAHVGWRLADDRAVGPEVRRLGLLLLGALAVYLPSALFHDLSLLHTDQWLLFAVAGAATSGWLSRGVEPAPLRAANPTTVPPHGAYA